MASIASTTDKTEKLHAPSAERNAADICALLHTNSPPSGEALELASGTGQHIVALATAMPNLRWQPTEVDESRLKSIAVYLDESELSNTRPPFALDATKAGWDKSVEAKDLIVLVNLLHLLSGIEANTLISEAMKTLKSGGKLFLYGPFKRSGQLTSDGDIEFDANIRANDPDTGYKNDQDIITVAESAGLTFLQSVEMRANNLALLFQK